MSRASRLRDKNAATNARLNQIHIDLTHKRVQYHRAYQPLSVGETKSPSSSRNPAERWEYVRDGIDATGSRNLIDFGCAEGYYVRKAAEHGLVSVGVDYNPTALNLVENARMIDRAERCSFILATLEPPLVAKLPVFDCVLCFSILHHIMRKEGLEHTKDIIAGIRRITGKVLFFDIGQPDEHPRWREVLHFMGDDPEAWIADFLREAGYSKPEKIAVVKGVKGQGDRHLFRCVV